MAPDYWDRDLTPFETDMASVIELVWVAHVTFIGVIILAIGLMASEPLRARLGAIAIGSLGGSQLLAGGLASGYDYQFADGAAAAAPFLVMMALGLAACVANWNAAPAPEAVDR
jgi:Na+/proline symporter